MIRESSPPEAILERGFGASPGFEERRNSTLSNPFAEISFNLSILTSNIAFFIPRSESSFSTFFVSSSEPFFLFSESVSATLRPLTFNLSPSLSNSPIRSSALSIPSSSLSTSSLYFSISETVFPYFLFSLPIRSSLSSISLSLSGSKLILPT